MKEKNLSQKTKESKKMNELPNIDERQEVDKLQEGNESEKANDSRRPNEPQRMDESQEANEHHKTETVPLSSSNDSSASAGGRKRLPTNRPMMKREHTDIEKQYETVPDTVPQKIYVLGTGSIGKLVAHALRSLPRPPPVTLLFYRAAMYKAWEAGPKHITIHRDGVDIQQSGFEAELIAGPRMQHGVIVPDDEGNRPDEGEKPHEVAQRLAEQQADDSLLYARKKRPHGIHVPRDIIDHVIVTTKTHATVNAMLMIKPRIRSRSTVCLLQNGMGVIDELNEKVFTDPEQRPKYIQGVISHGANVPPVIAQHDPFYAVHAGQGTIALALMTPEETDQRHYARYLLRTLTRSPILVAATHTTTNLLQLQLEKLAVNCVLNPLTSLLDARNGAILNSFDLTRTMRLMLAEISLVIRNLPELRGLPNVPNRFAVRRLEAAAVNVANVTANNISSMLQDVRAGRQTEIEYINGYIVRRGEELGIRCVVNYGIMNTVIAKAQLVGKEKSAELPMEENPDLNRGD